MFRGAVEILRELSLHADQGSFTRITIGDIGLSVSARCTL
jgi:hypothetical protein